MHNREDGLKRTLKGKVYAYSNLGPCFNVLLALPLVADTIYIYTSQLRLAPYTDNDSVSGSQSEAFFRLIMKISAH